MRTQTMMMLGAAALCAGFAAMLTSIITSVQPAPTTRTDQREAPRSRVIVVASRNFAPGERISPEMLRRIDWPTQRLPSGAFSSINQVSGGGATRFALSPISKGEPVLSSKLSRPGRRPSLLNQLEESKSAVTISVNTVQGVAGFIQPNDRVDVLLTRKTGRGDIAAAGGSGIYTDILLQNIRVLAIDQRQSRSEKAVPARAVTLEVDQVEAQKLTLGTNVGTLSLALKNTASSSNPTSNTRRVSLDDLPGPTRATDTGVQGAPSVVTIVRGTKSQRYGVLEEHQTHRGPATHSIRRIEAKTRATEQPPVRDAAPAENGVQAQRVPAKRQQAGTPHIPGPINARTTNKVQSWAARTTVTRSQPNGATGANPPSTRDPKN